MASEQVLLPLPCVAGHVHLDAKAQRRTHDANAQAEIAGRAHADRAAGEHLAGPIARKRPVGLGRARCPRGLPGDEQPLPQGKVLGVLEHLVDAPTRLHRARDRQVAVLLEQEPARESGAMALVEHRAHGGDLHEFRLDDPAALARLGEEFRDERGKPLQPCARVVDVRGTELLATTHLVHGLASGVCPLDRLPRREAGKDRRPINELVSMHPVHIASISK